MDIEDFLKKYLPDELRGEVTLKKRSEEFKRIQKIIFKEIIKFKEEWLGLSDDSLSDLTEVLQEMSRILKINGEYEGFVVVLVDSKNKVLNGVIVKLMKS